ncbi:MAG: effector-binding domain-containing protein [Planctomycetota bacterium]
MRPQALELRIRSQVPATARVGLVHQHQTQTVRKPLDLDDADRHDRAMHQLIPNLVLFSCCLLSACIGLPAGDPAPVVTDIALSRTPYARVHTNWKERLPQSYAYREVLGDYRQSSQHLVEMRTEAYRYGLAISGPAFCLFYDDPGETPMAELRSRICLPVHAGEVQPGPWQFDVLPRSTVVYAAVSGPHRSVALSYSAIFNHIAENGWTVSGPICEIYLADPELDSRITEVITEVQIPWITRN